jgi:uncharacterized protein (TIGR03000 family)
VVAPPASTPPATKPPDMGKPKAAGPNQATVIVQVPADAQLYIDGMQAPLTSATRSFITPDLRQGQDYVYTLKAVVDRNGEKKERTEKVFVRAGQESRVDLRNLDGTQTGPARVTVKVPEDARLFVDNVACPLTSTVRSFETPALEQGKSFAYNLRAEVTRNGKTMTESRKVLVEAGKTVEVEFKNFAAVETVSR